LKRETTGELPKVAVIGLGYIGLPTAAILASTGHDVVGVDVNGRTVDAVNRGEVPFVEPDLASYVAGAVSRGKLSATTETPRADIYIIAVPTPLTDRKSPDISYIEAAARGIAPQLKSGNLVILESTSPPGTTEYLGQYLDQLRPDLALNPDPAAEAHGRLIHLAHCPERVLPGRVMIELVTNDRIVGGLTPEASRLSKALYSTFCQGEILTTNARTAEAAKLVENAYRDVNIAFANELSLVSARLDVDVWELIGLANHHPRVNILQPGPGVGGHCIAVDPWFMIAAAPEEALLMRQARSTNDAKPAWVVDQVSAAVADNPAPTIAALGLAFKANIDDLRESPAVRIVQDMAGKIPQARILAVDPHIDALPAALEGLGNVKLAGREEAAAAADVVVLLVDHDAFKEMDRSALAGKKVIDTRGIWRSR